MPFIVWNDRLSVGVEALDGDHKQLVVMLNELYDGILAGNGREQVEQLFDRLAGYIRIHFAREEELFARAGYPEAEVHQHEHSNLGEWLAGMRARYELGIAPGPALEAVNFLKDWLFDHILGSDQKYVPYMKALGLR